MITKEAILIAADPTYANCLLCSVSPDGRCSICDDRYCPKHMHIILGMKYCELCHAIELAHQRTRVVNVVLTALLVKIAEPIGKMVPISRDKY